jgi:hypothetical protein
MVQMHDNSYANEGAFAIGLEGIVPISPSPTPLVPGGIVKGTIDAPIDVKQFTFDGHKGDVITLAMTSAATQGGFVADANVFTPSGVNIDNFTATGQRYLTLPEDGTYMVQMHDNSYANEGAFAIGLEGIVPISPSPTPLVPGGIVKGTIDAPIDVKQFTFDGQAGDIITLAMTSTATHGGFVADANVFAPSGTDIDNFTATGQRYLTLQETGTYMVQMHDNNYADEGAFTIGLEGIAPISPGSKPLLPGGIVKGTIDAPIDVKQFTFDGHKGDIITLAMTSTATHGGFVADANVFTPSGNNIDNFTATGQRYLTLPEDGTYMVQVHDNSYASEGAFTIGLEGIAPISPGARPLVSGGIVKGTIDAAIDVKQFTFTAQDGDVLALSMTSTATQGGFVADANVFAPSGTNIDNFTATGMRYITVHETGTFMVQVHDTNYNRKGAFTLGLEGISPPSPHTPTLLRRRPRTGVITQPNGVVQYLFSAQANATLHITLASRADQRGFLAHAEIFDSAGNMVTSFSAGRQTFVAPDTGVYLLQIHDANFAKKGHFTITIS